MYRSTAAYDDLIRQSSRTFKTKIVDGQTVITEGITKLKKTTGAVSGDTFTIGSVISGYVEVELKNPPAALEGHEIEVLTGMQVGSGIEYIPDGLYTVEKPEKDENSIKFTAFDRMMNLEKGYFSNLSENTNTVSVLNEISSKTGVPIVTSGLSSYAMKKPKGYTCREVLSYIAQMYAGFAICNRKGEIEIRSFQMVDYSVDISRYWGSFKHNDFSHVIGRITCSTGKGEEGNNKSITAGSSGRMLYISNPFMTQAQLNTVLDRLKSVSFMPGELKILGDNRLDPGDIITVNDINGNAYPVACTSLSQTFDGGLTTEIKAAGESETETEQGFSGPNTKNMDRYAAELALIEHAVIGKLDAEGANILYAKITDLDAINATIQNLDVTYATIDLANIKNGCITTAMIGTGVIGTTQIADGSITDAKIVGLTANKITAGTIDAANIEVINLNCANLTVGTINGQQIAPGAVDMDKLSDGVIQMIEEAKEGANGNKIYYQTSAPAGSGLKAGDTWFDTDDGYKIYRYTGTAWSAALLDTNAFAAYAITAAKIESGAITTDKLSANAVTAAKIAAGTITAAQIAASTITGSKISSYTITATNLSSGCITADKIVSRAITAAQIATATITANEIKANTITAAEIASGAISSDKIQAGAVTASKISVGDLSALGATIGGFQITTTYIRCQSSPYNMYIASYAYNNSTVMRVQDNGVTKFLLNYDGSLTATDATIKGTVEATGITFGKSSYARISGGSIAIGATGRDIIFEIYRVNSSGACIAVKNLYVHGYSTNSAGIPIIEEARKCRDVTLTLKNSAGNNVQLVFYKGLLVS